MNPDFRDLFAEFNARGVEFLVVGAHALAAHGLVRATKDLGVWVRPEAANAERTFAVLAAFGAPLHDLTVDDLARPGLIFQIGVQPIRIDVITAIDGVEFEDAWRDRVDARFGDQAVAVPPAPQPFVREGPKVGRNDPSRCGSGKKYKRCCGRR